MRAIDTNVLVRLIARDEPKQVKAADAFVSRGAWVSHIVLAETVWVLTSVFEFGPKQIALAVGMLLNHAQLTLQDADVVQAALQGYRLRPGVSFTDHLIVEIARKSGNLPIGTIDRDLSAIEGAERL